MTSQERFKPYCAVFLLALKDGKVLLQRRFNTGYKDGWYTVPSGHVENGETASQAILREAAEETGITIPPDSLLFTHVLHRSSPQEEGSRIYVDFFFSSDSWKGEPRITEPDKCDELGWFDTGSLPENTLPYIRHVLGQIGKSYYSEFDWN